MTSIDASEKIKEKTVHANLQDETQKRQTKHELGDLVRMADIKRILSKGDITKWSKKN